MRDTLDVELFSIPLAYLNLFADYTTLDLFDNLDGTEDTVLTG
jgi:hypothetical protein